jgi:hypothetical protein
MLHDALDLCAEALDRAGYLITIARLGVLDWLAGPYPETPADRVRAQEGQRLRHAFRAVDFDTSNSLRAMPLPLAEAPRNLGLDAGRINGPQASLSVD